MEKSFSRGYCKASWPCLFGVAQPEAGKGKSRAPAAAYRGHRYDTLYAAIRGRYCRRPEMAGPRLGRTGAPPIRNVLVGNQTSAEVFGEDLFYFRQVVQPIGHVDSKKAVFNFIVEFVANGFG